MHASSILFIVAAVIFALDFLAGFAGETYARYRINAAAFFCLTLALFLTHGK
ncbi:MAG: hypothetical protein LC793_05115 [Thermomicrobia bacterium]|nr:hypothetical protein [Thermomicrobia bacterium]MCA1724700.1 hypothetical protein [Thermomicrobia bacterium]